MAHRKLMHTIRILHMVVYKRQQNILYHKGGIFCEDNYFLMLIDSQPEIEEMSCERKYILMRRLKSMGKLVFSVLHS